MKYTQEQINLMRGYNHSIQYISNWGQGESARLKNRQIITKLEAMGIDLTETDMWEIVDKHYKL